MSKKYQVTLSDSLNIWLENEAEIRGIRPSTLISVLVGECVKNQLNQKNLQIMLDRMKDISPDKWVELVESELKNDD